MPVIGAILGWFARLTTSAITWLGAALLGQVVSHQAAEAIARVARIALWIAITIAAVNAVVPPQFTSFSNLWEAYSGELGEVGQYIGYFVPLPLLFTLLDLYLGAVLVMFVISVVRRVSNFGQ